MDILDGSGKYVGVSGADLDAALTPEERAELRRVATPVRAVMSPYRERVTAKDEDLIGLPLAGRFLYCCFSMKPAGSETFEAFRALLAHALDLEIDIFDHATGVLILGAKP